jgi:WD40 repeat protein
MTSLSLTGVDKQLAALMDEEIPVRVAAVRSLGEQREASAIEPLMAALHDSAWEVRAAAVWALGKFGEQAPLEALMRATDDEDGSVRAAALRTLELLGEHKPIEPLLARLNDEHTAVREAARMALEQSHPEALSPMLVDPIMITQESSSNTASGVREQEQPDPGVEVEARVKAPSTGDSTLIQFTTHVRTLLSRVVRDVVAPLADTRSTSAEEEVSNVIVREPVQTKPRRLRHIAEGVLAALIIAGLVASWLVIQQRLHPSQGSTSTPLLAYHGHADGPAVWSSDSKYVSFLADSTPAGETVLVWNRATGQVTKHLLHTLLAQAQEHQAVFASDGKHLAFVERDSSSKVAVQVWDVVAWRSIFTTDYSSPNGYLAVYWSRDSTRIVIPAEDGTIQVWNVVTGHELVTCHVPPLDQLPINISMSPDGHSVIFGSGPPNMYLLDLTTCKLLTLPSFDAVATFWSPQGNRFATVSLTDNSMVQIWDAVTGQKLNFYQSPGNSVKIVAWSPDSRTIATGSTDGTVRVWYADRSPQTYHSDPSAVLNIAWSPDGKSIATGNVSGSMWVWKVN